MAKGKLAGRKAALNGNDAVIPIDIVSEVSVTSRTNNIQPRPQEGRWKPSVGFAWVFILVSDGHFRHEWTSVHVNWSATFVQANVPIYPPLVRKPRSPTTK